MVAAIGLATVHGGLWPLDLRFSALIAAGGIAVLAIAWWPALLLFGLVALLLARPIWRLALWPIAILVMAALHAAFGPDLGFIPLAALGPVGLLRLYALPVALPIVLGSALRDTLFPRKSLLPRNSGLPRKSGQSAASDNHSRRLP